MVSSEIRSSRDKKIYHPQIEFSNILQQLYGKTIPLSAHHVYWECLNCPQDLPLPPLPPWPPPEFF